MVFGVKNGYEKQLEIVGVGYQATLKGVIRMRVGFANEVQRAIPEGLTVTCPDQTHVVIRAPTSKRSASSPPKCARSASQNRTRARAFVTTAKIKLKPGKAASK